MRRLLALTVALVLLSVTWLRSEVPKPDNRPLLQLTALALVPGCCRIGPLKLVGAWQLQSRHGAFGGYSALLRIAPGRLLAFSDRGYLLEFSEPGSPQRQPQFGATLSDREALKVNRDVESATQDPATGRIWLALEGRNALARHRAKLSREAFQLMPEWQNWPQNSGPEAMVRLADGRFMVVCECRTTWFGSNLHPGFVYSGDPIANPAGQAFTMAGIPGFRPTDVAQLPDGRVLILARRLTWPVPARFAIKVLIADPAEIKPGGIWQAHELADLADPWPIDNYEGLAIERMADGKLIGWIVSDENGAVSQRALLLKVEIDEAALPPKQKAPGSTGRP